MTETLDCVISTLITDENDYVFVEIDDDEFEILNDDSYDHCEEEMSILSRSPSSSASVCTETMFLDVVEMASSVVSLDGMTNDGDLTSKTSMTESKRKVSIDRSEDEASKPLPNDHSSKQQGSRLCNKKRRKKIKLMKKAAAMAAANAALAQEKSVLSNQGVVQS